MFSFDMKCT